MEQEVLRLFEEYRNENEHALELAAVKTLTRVIKDSEVTTMMELLVDLKVAMDAILSIEGPSGTSISLTAVTELFNIYVTGCGREILDFTECKKRIVERGEQFAAKAASCRADIASLVCRFINEGSVLFLHGYSPVCTQCCIYAASKGKNFTVIVTEARPELSGYQTAKELTQAGIPVKVVLDAAVGHVMEQASLVLLGAEGVVENGGIINKIGTVGICMVAKALKRPVYVATESYKFARVFPLNQADLPKSCTIQKEWNEKGGQPIPENVTVDNPTCDYTKPEYITSIFSDLGVLSPSAVSDELIKLYY